MTSLQLRRVALATGGLLVLWGLARLLAHGSDQVRGAFSVPHVPLETTDTIYILKGPDTVRLAQTPAGVWTVNGHPTTPGAGADLVNAIDDTAPRDLAAQSPTSFARMGVDTGAWTLVLGPLAHPKLSLLVGGNGPGYGTGYVRKAGSDSVYLWRGSLPTLVRRPPDVWRDHRIGGALPDSIRSVTVTGVGRPYTLTREKQRWLVGAAAADSSKVAILLAQLRNVEAQGFATPAQVDSLARHAKAPRRTLTVRGAGTTPLLALTLDSLSGAIWVTKPGDPTVYRMETWSVSQLLPTAASLTAHP